MSRTFFSLSSSSPLCSFVSPLTPRKRGRDPAVRLNPPCSCSLYRMGNPQRGDSSRGMIKASFFLQLDDMLSVTTVWALLLNMHELAIDPVRASDFCF
ncbi:hypothetical protein BJY04DRAFT_69012 [Aspergillus karnatakaensis]|uniref:uncharacterized protein n=1 Tax=Aspergillus karnatakaensis TaxID=1810916 RepID=UPI003CCD64DE